MPHSATAQRRPSLRMVILSPALLSIFRDTSLAISVVYFFSIAAFRFSLAAFTVARSAASWSR